MNSESRTQIDWFDWAESFMADLRARETEWRETFAPRAEQVLHFAAQAAHSLSHDAVGAEHLLAGVLKLSSGKAFSVLRRAGLTLPLLREEIESERGEGGKGKVNLPLHYTPRCRGIIQRVRAKLIGLEGVRVEPEDLLMALLAENDGLCTKIFLKQAINVDENRSALKDAGEQ